MCGRYSLGKKPRSWPEGTEDFQPRFNIAPGHDAAVLVNESSIVLKTMRWGLVPFWAEDESTGYKMINAKAETLAERPAFRRCLEKQRCVVPADGFYEWRKSTHEKTPVRFVLGDGEPFAFAGLREKWRKPGGNVLESFTIITTEANELVRPVHDRMPVILDAESALQWLDPEREFRSVQSLLQPIPGRLMRCHLVSRRINDTRFDDVSCIEPVPELQ